MALTSFSPECREIFLLNSGPARANSMMGAHFADVGWMFDLISGADLAIVEAIGSED